jgi:hypothetical protein
LYDPRGGAEDAEKRAEVGWSWRLENPGGKPGDVVDHGQAESLIGRAKGGGRFGYFDTVQKNEFLGNSVVLIDEGFFEPLVFLLRDDPVLIGFLEILELLTD